VIHLDNYSVHKRQASADWLEENGMPYMSYSPYSPDLASSDFYLSPTVKERLERIQVVDEDQFSECLQKILSVSTEKN
jgi:hypothetical protein